MLLEVLDLMEEGLEEVHLSKMQVVKSDSRMGEVPYLRVSKLDRTSTATYHRICLGFQHTTNQHFSFIQITFPEILSG